MIMSKSEDSSNKLPWSILLAGAVAGMSLAIGSLVQGSKLALPDAYAAKVNKTLISMDSLEQKVRLLANDKTNAITTQDREFVLERMIDEELLVQQGLDMGLAENHRLVRSALIQVVRQSLLSDDSDVSAQELREFYRANESVFTRPPQYLLRAWSLADTKTPLWLTNVSTEGFTISDEQKKALSDFTPLPVPLAYLPSDGLIRYLSKADFPALRKLEVGQFLLGSNGDKQVLYYLEGRKSANVPELDSIRETVERAYQQQQQEQRFRTYLVTLRRQADIVR